MVRISVITPSVRPEGLEIVNTALKRQTFKDFEWLIGSEFDPKLGTWVKDNFKGGVWTLNRIYNKLIKQAKGDLIVSLQDFTLIDPDALERLWRHYEANPGIVVSGVGGKYDKVYPQLGKLLWEDPRKTTGYTTFNNIEFNFCAVPKQAFIDVGGFDEELDFLGYGMDGFSVVDRLDIIGYKFFLDTDIKSYSLEHDRAEDWEEKNLIHGGYQKHRESYSQPVLNYLS